MNKPFSAFCPELPPTTNMAYKVGKGHLYKTADCKDWQEKAAFIVGAKHGQQFQEWKGKFLSCSLYFMDSSVLVSDIDGRVKPVLDCLSQKLGFDDRYILKMQLFQIKGPFGIFINLREMTESEIEEIETKWKTLVAE